jgi:hypothetical protein
MLDNGVGDFLTFKIPAALIVKHRLAIGAAQFPTTQYAGRIARSPARALGNLPSEPGNQRSDEVCLLRKGLRPQ